MSPKRQILQSQTKNKNIILVPDTPANISTKEGQRSKDKALNNDGDREIQVKVPTKRGWKKKEDEAKVPAKRGRKKKEPVNSEALNNYGGDDEMQEPDTTPAKWSKKNKKEHVNVVLNNDDDELAMAPTNKNNTLNDDDEDGSENYIDDEGEDNDDGIQEPPANLLVNNQRPTIPSKLLEISDDGLSGGNFSL